MPHEELSLWLQIIFINVVNYFEELSRSVAGAGSSGLHNGQYVSTESRQVTHDTAIMLLFSEL